MGQASCRASSPTSASRRRGRQPKTSFTKSKPPASRSNLARIVSETISGSTAAAQRRGFIRLMDKLESGDILVVTKLDRLGRNAMDVRATVDRLATLGVRVHCLALGGADLTSAAGKMTMQVIAAVAEFERDFSSSEPKPAWRAPGRKGNPLAGPALLRKVSARMSSGNWTAAPPFPPWPAAMVESW